MERAEVGRMSQPGELLYGVELTYDGLIAISGRIPIQDADGAVIGAVGVRGNTEKTASRSPKLQWKPATGVSLRSHEAVLDQAQIWRQE